MSCVGEGAVMEGGDRLGRGQGWKRSGQDGGRGPKWVGKVGWD